MKTKSTQVILFLSLFALASSRAEDWFQISWSGTVHSYDATGKMTAKSYSSRDVLNSVAVNHRLNPNDLVLVYRPSEYDTAVVFKNAAAMARAGVSQRGQVVGDYFQMPDATRVGKGWITDVTDNGETARQAYLFDEHTDPIGSITGIEKQRRDAKNKITSESFHGTFQFSIRNDSHSVAPPGVYSGTFSTGGRIKDIRHM
jgi:hypothetical protein